MMGILIVTLMKATTFVVTMDQIATAKALPTPSVARAGVGIVLIVALQHVTNISQPPAIAPTFR